MVCIPFFGDQPANASLLVDAGCAELIGKAPPMSFVVSNLYKEGDFTAESVAAILGKLLAEPRYKEAAERLQRCALATGGVSQAVQEIEWAARYGTEHLTSKALRRSLSGSNPLSGVVVTITVAAMAAVGLSYGRLRAWAGR